MRVNAILPSVIDTPGNRPSQPDADTSKWVGPSSRADDPVPVLRRVERHERHRRPVDVAASEYLLGNSFWVRSGAGARWVVEVLAFSRLISLEWPPPEDPQSERGAPRRADGDAKEIQHELVQRSVRTAGTPSCGARSGSRDPRTSWSRSSTTRSSSTTARTSALTAWATTAARVWRACDGKTDVGALSQALDLSVDTVNQALAGLEEASEADPTLKGWEVLQAGSGNGDGMTRRQMTRRSAKVGGAALAAPLIYSIAVPSPAAAADADEPSMRALLDGSLRVKREAEP